MSVKLSRYLHGFPFLNDTATEYIKEKSQSLRLPTLEMIHSFNQQTIFGNQPFPQPFKFLRLVESFLRQGAWQGVCYGMCALALDCYKEGFSVNHVSIRNCWESIYGAQLWAEDGIARVKALFRDVWNKQDYSLLKRDLDQGIPRIIALWNSQYCHAVVAYEYDYHNRVTFYDPNSPHPAQMLVVNPEGEIIYEDYTKFALVERGREFTVIHRGLAKSNDFLRRILGI